MASTGKSQVKSVGTMFTVLNGLMELNGAGVTELARHLDVPKSTIHSYLSSLEEEDYVNNTGGEYQVGLRFLELGAYARNQQKLFRVAKPEVDRLADETGELANVMVEEHGKGSYLYRARGDKAIQVKATVGSRVPLHTTGLGKAILAHLPEKRVDKIVDLRGLKPDTANSITDRNELERSLQEVRDQGVAIDKEERLKGLHCVATPVLNNKGDVLGAISVSGPTHRFHEERLRNELTQKVLEVANVIELNITHS